MMNQDPRMLPASAGGRLGLLLAQLEEGRARTLRLLEQVPDEWLDREEAAFPNSISTQLLHLAAIEADWLYVDLLARPIPAEVQALFPFEDVRTAEGRLSAAPDLDRARLLELLVTCRSLLVTEAERQVEEELDRVITGLEGASSAAWILTHLAQHEAEHRGMMKRALSAWGARP